MAGPPARRRRAQLAALGVAAVISAVGAVAWSRTVADDGADERIDAALDEPGEYLEPSAPTNPPVTGEPLSTAELESPDGERTALRSDGRPMVVNIWYTRCPPCARELGDFAAVDADVGEAVRFVGVNTQDSVASMRDFAAERGVTYELWRDTTYDFVDDTRVAGFPTTLFVDATGTIVDQTGPVDSGELRSLLAEHFGVTS